MSQQQHNHLGQPIGAPLPEWQVPDRPSRGAMEGRFCRVEALDAERHSAELWAAFCADAEGRSWTYLPYGPFQSEDELRAWLVEKQADEDPLFYVVVDLADGEAVGMASYLRIEPTMGSIEVGHIHFADRLKRTPLATEAMFLMLSRAFDELGYRRYEWKCDALNGASKAAAERLGFCYEGTFRQCAIYKKRNRDTAWFAIVDTDWPRLKAGFERWLATDNFDPQGSQRNGLQVCIEENE